MKRKKEKGRGHSDLDGSAHFVVPEVFVSFLKNVMPFNTLDEEGLRVLAEHCRIDFFPKGHRLMTVDETEITHLYLIQRGGVKAFLYNDKGEEVLKDYRGEGAYIGALGIIRDTRANLNIETIEDTFCFLLPRQVFLDLVRNTPSISHFFLKSFSDQVVSTAYMELRQQKVRQRSAEDLYLFTMNAGDLAKPAQTMSVKSTIQEVARKMARLRIGSMLLHDPENSEEIIGIVTDTDLRSQVVATGLDYGAPIEDVMSRPVQTVLAEEICFDVLLKMMSTGIRHLAVEKGGRITGIITSHDIMVLQGNSPFYIYREIANQYEIEGLYPIVGRIPELIGNLVREGGKAGNISRMISVINDQILRQLLTLLEKELGPPPLPYCWLLMGSEGRREQTFLTDQDNALIYADPYSEDQKNAAAAYFSRLSEKAFQHLSKCGYPPCPANVMAVNPRWCQPFSVWKGYFSNWVTQPNPSELLEASIFFDFRAGAGDEKLAVSLRNHLLDLAPRFELFAVYLARQCKSIRVPLSFFKNFIVERDGEHRNRLDLKLRGLQPIVGFARVLALRHGLKETNTIARLQALQGENVLPVEVCNEAVKAFELQMQFRLFHQLEQLDQGRVPDNFIEPERLTEMERTMLKDAFEIIEKLQTLLEKHFPAL